MESFCLDAFALFRTLRVLPSLFPQVVVIDPSSSYFERTGKIVKDDKDSSPFKIRWDSDGSTGGYFRPWQVARASVASAPTAIQATLAMSALESAFTAAQDTYGVDLTLLRDARAKLAELKKAATEAPLRAAIAAADATVAAAGAGVAPASRPPNVTTSSNRSQAEKIMDGDEQGTYWESAGGKVVELTSSTSGVPLGKLEIYCRHFGTSYEVKAAEIFKKTGSCRAWSRVKSMSLPESGGWLTLLTEDEAGSADSFKVELSCDGRNCRVAGMRVGGGNRDDTISYAAMVAQLEGAIADADSVDGSLLREAREKLVLVRKAALEAPLRAALVAATAALAEPAASAPVAVGPPEVECGSTEEGHPGSNMFDGDEEGTYWQSNGARRVTLRSSTAGVPLGKLEIYRKHFGSSYEPREVRISKKIGASGRWTEVATVRLSPSGGWFTLLSAAEAGDADRLKIDITDCDSGIDCKIAGLRVSGGHGIAASAVLAQMEAAISASVHAGITENGLLSEARSKLALVKKAATEAPLRAATAAAVAALMPPAPTVASGPPNVKTSSNRSNAGRIIDGNVEGSYWQSDGDRVVELSSSAPGVPLGKLEIYCRRFGHSYEARVVELYKKTGARSPWSRVKSMSLPASGGWKTLLSEAEAGSADHFKVDISDCDGGTNCRIAGMRVSGNCDSGASSLTAALAALEEAIAAGTSASLPASLLNEAKRQVPQLKKRSASHALEVAMAGTDKASLEAALAAARGFSLSRAVIRSAEERLEHLIATTRVRDEAIEAMTAALSGAELLECFTFWVSGAEAGTFGDSELDEHRQRLGELLVSALDDADPDARSGSLEAFRAAVDQATTAEPHVGATCEAFKGRLSPARIQLAKLEVEVIKRQERVDAGCSNGGALPDMPKEFICPITLEPMVDPVTASDGYTYERKAIEHSLSSGNSRSPMTNERMDDRVVANRTLKIMIAEWADKEHNRIVQALKAKRQSSPAGGAGPSGVVSSSDEVGGEPAPVRKLKRTRSATCTEMIVSEIVDWISADMPEGCGLRNKSEAAKAASELTAYGCDTVKDVIDLLSESADWAADPPPAQWADHFTILPMHKRKIKAGADAAAKSKKTASGGGGKKQKAEAPAAADGVAAAAAPAAASKSTAAGKKKAEPTEEAPKPKRPKRS